MDGKFDENINNVEDQDITSDHGNALNQDNASNKDDPDINNFSMDIDGHIRKSTGAAAVSPAGARMFIILGWICAALTAFVYPLFAIAGIIFGVLANRRTERSGNVVIFTNIVVAAAFYLLRFIFSIVLGRATI